MQEKEQEKRRNDSFRAARVGTTNTMRNGMKAKVVAYRCANDIDVEYEDGAVAEHKTWKRFQDGLIAHPSKYPENRVGLKKKMLCGDMCEIIAYRTAYDIDVRFENGVEIQHKTFDAFQKGIISCRTHHIGEKHKQNCGVVAELVEWNSSLDVVIRFENDGTEKHCVYRYFKDGKVGHPNIKFTTYRRPGGPHVNC